MCGILAVLGCSDDSQAKRARVLELSRRQPSFIPPISSIFLFLIRKRFKNIQQIIILCHYGLLKHRGPDWSGLYQHDDCFIAHQRLAIVDPASGDQPLYNEDKSIVVAVNGEIYNHEDLRSRLPDHKFKTGSDCEVITHLYEEHGENFVDMLDGMFSFVLLDTHDNSFISARDGIGITPLYIGWGLEGSVWISSEMKGLNDECEHFEVFPPGHLYSSKVGGFKRWYNPPWFSETIPSNPYDPIALRHALEDAVIKRLMTDVPFGVLLSGGLDSSLVASITARHLSGTKAAKQWGAQLHSFSIGLEGSPDLKAAIEVGDYLGTVHHELHFSVQKDGIDAIEDVIYHIETYDVTTVRASTPMFLMARKIKSMGVKMVISGEGADEIFGGYLYFHKAPNKEEFHRETCRKIKAIHLYDCLRANKSTSAWGLEVRVPFLDKEFINVVMSIDPEMKMIDIEKNRIEKWILRRAFDDENHPYLPKHILYRQKEQFSDGVGYSWIDGLKDHAALHVTDKMMLNATHIFPHNTPMTKEAYYYRMIFERFFPQALPRLIDLIVFSCSFQNSAILTVPGGASVACSTAKAIEWDAAWSNHLDPSGRAALGVHQSDYEQLLAPDKNTTKIVDNGPRSKTEKTTTELTMQS
ncbi:hypothetical protein OSB04_021056 [Centaurea solstitialis]|uniref:asparagine synthase (glutamine-hydrolyzing) n=1 Tax=Centaurea solstitialis TaxID=347529 RepID=A0AA38TD62_9ASTR|nr:hypothetical protein OSB04_021056 [Centaurea solstitialis]